MQTTKVKHVVSHARLVGYLDPTDPSTAEATSEKLAHFRGLEFNVGYTLMSLNLYIIWVACQWFQKLFRPDEN